MRRKTSGNTCARPISPTACSKTTPQSSTLASSHGVAFSTSSVASSPSPAVIGLLPVNHSEVWYYLRNDWEMSFERRRAADCYAQLVTWYHGDISANPLYGGEFVRALKAIKARVLLLPGQTDLYFRVADNELERAHLAHAELTPIPSIWGHRAGNPASIPADTAFLKAAGLS